MAKLSYIGNVGPERVARGNTLLAASVLECFVEDVFLERSKHI